MLAGEGHERLCPVSGMLRCSTGGLWRFFPLEEEGGAEKSWNGLGQTTTPIPCTTRPSELVHGRSCGVVGEGVFKIWLNLSLSDSIGRFGVISLFRQSRLCLLPVTMIDEHVLPDFCLKHSRLLLYFLLPNLTGGVSEWVSSCVMFSASWAGLNHNSHYWNWLLE